MLSAGTSTAGGAPSSRRSPASGAGRCSWPPSTGRHRRRRRRERAVSPCRIRRPGMPPAGTAPHPGRHGRHRRRRAGARPPCGSTPGSSPRGVKSTASRTAAWQARAEQHLRGDPEAGAGPAAGGIVQGRPAEVGGPQPAGRRDRPGHHAARRPGGRRCAPTEPADANGRKGVALWLDDWDGYLQSRRDQAERMRAGEDAPFRVARAGRRARSRSAWTSSPTPTACRAASSPTTSADRLARPASALDQALAIRFDSSPSRRRSCQRGSRDRRPRRTGGGRSDLDPALALDVPADGVGRGAGGHAEVGQVACHHRAGRDGDVAADVGAGQHDRAMAEP